MVDPPVIAPPGDASAATDGVTAGPVGTVAAFFAGSSSHDAMNRTASRRGIERFIRAPTTFRVADLPRRPRPFFGGRAISEWRSLALRTGLATGVPLSKGTSGSSPQPI